MENNNITTLGFDSRTGVTPFAGSSSGAVHLK